MRFSLSSSVRQTTASASATPSSVKRSMSVPSPQMARPFSSASAASRLRSRLVSMIFTATSASSSILARKRPVRPAPMIMTCSSFLASRCTKVSLNFSISAGSPMKYALSCGSRQSSPCGMIMRWSRKIMPARIALGISRSFSGMFAKGEWRVTFVSKRRTLPLAKSSTSSAAGVMRMR